MNTILCEILVTCVVFVVSLGTRASRAGRIFASYKLMIAILTWGGVSTFGFAFSIRCRKKLAITDVSYTCTM